MLLIPAIDLKDGQCVRLRQGDMNAATIFEADPLVAAKRWVDAGCQRLHLVDLDGAIAGEPINATVIARITAAYPDLSIQIGGGIRDLETAAYYIECGVQYVIIGTKAVTDPHFIKELCVHFPDQVIVGLDAKNGQVAVDGWTTLSSDNVIDTAKKFEEYGVSSIIYTDIGRDGMMQGVNIAATLTLAQAISIPVIASGGVTNLNDIKQLLSIANQGVSGVVIGRALYEGTLDFDEAQQLVDQYQTAVDTE